MPNFNEPQHYSSPGRTTAGAAAPLSPQPSVSSVGSVRSAASTSHPAASSTSSSSTSRDQYRALTSTSAERKRTVAACRALRAQITQFEDAFIQMHGRAPKGASERAPLASTYMQYREWKRAIRADAACRIQALCRGASARSMLIRGQDKRVARFVSDRRAERLLLTSPPSNKSPASLNHLSIPLDMGGDGAGSDVDSAGGGLMRTRLETRTTSDSSGGQRIIGGDEMVEVEMIPVPSSPNWRNRQSSSQSQSQQQQQKASTSPSGGAHKSSSRSRSSSLPDVSVMSLAELQQRKRELKQQLKLYDMNFHAQHGRMPEKREKEPIRHLYESYNAYKNQISVIEKGEALPGPGTAAFRSSAADVAVGSPTATGVSSPTTSYTPTPGSVGNASSPGGSSGQYYTRSPSGASSVDSIDATNITPSSHGEESMSAAAAATASSSADVSSQDLATLKAEKATLHQMLRSYEKDFYRQHKRQVSSFADIRPVASQYRRYKEIKKAIALKSGQGGSSSGGGGGSG